MPFLIIKGGTNAGVIISLVLLCGAEILFSNNSQFIYIIPSLAILVCAALVVLWWRSGIHRLYINRLKENELQILNNSLKEKEERIEYLERQNGELSKVIHKDNKLIPAMELAVKSYLTEVSSLDTEQLHIKGLKLLQRLEEMSLERQGILSLYQAQSKKLPLTNIASVDALLTYMLSKASAGDITLDLTLSGSIKFMAENEINESDLNTVLADLIENALIAVKDSAVKKVLVNIGVLDSVYVISVFDSGEPFAPEVLASFGRKKNTTHASEGGSGTGLMTLYELINKYKASIIIDEFTSSGSGYVKQVCVRFDKLNRLFFNTPKIKKSEPISLE